MKLRRVKKQSGELYGYSFDCPGCGFMHVVTTEWAFNGNLAAPTFNPSYLAWTDDMRCHSYITDGKIRFLPDCTHELAGKTVELPELA